MADAVLLGLLLLSFLRSAMDDQSGEVLKRANPTLKTRRDKDFSHRECEEGNCGNGSSAGDHPLADEPQATSLRRLRQPAK